MDELSNLVLAYCREYPKLREEYESLSNFDFNMEYGFRVKVPRDWDPEHVIPDVVEHFRQALIVYNTADEYSRLLDVIGAQHEVSFISWHEMYFAMYSKARDTRPLQKINKALNTAVVVVSSSFSVDQEVLFHIQTFATGCLICLE